MNLERSDYCLVFFMLFFFLIHLGFGVNNLVIVRVYDNIDILKNEQSAFSMSSNSAILKLSISNEAIPKKYFIHITSSSICIAISVVRINTFCPMNHIGVSNQVMSSETSLVF